MKQQQSSYYHPQLQAKENDHNDNQWTEYVRMISQLAGINMKEYAHQNSPLQHHEQEQSNQKLTKCKHFLQLLSSSQNIDTTKTITKHSLISSITSNLNKCSQLDYEMQKLLFMMSQTMYKCQRMRRDQITKFKLHQLQKPSGGDSLLSMVNNQRSQINQEMVEYFRMLNSSGDNGENNNNIGEFHDYEQQEVKIQRFDAREQLQRREYNNGDKLQEFERENELFVNNDNEKTNNININNIIINNNNNKSRKTSNSRRSNLRSYHNNNNNTNNNNDEINEIEI